MNWSLVISTFWTQWNPTHQLITKSVKQPKHVAIWYILTPSQHRQRTFKLSLMFSRSERYCSYHQSFIYKSEFFYNQSPSSTNNILCFSTNRLTSIAIMYMWKCCKCMRPIHSNIVECCFCEHLECEFCIPGSELAHLRNINLFKPRFDWDAVSAPSDYDLPSSLDLSSASKQHRVHLSAKKPEPAQAKRLALLLTIVSKVERRVDRWVEQLAQELAEKIAAESSDQSANQPVKQKPIIAWAAMVLIPSPWIQIPLPRTVSSGCYKGLVKGLRDVWFFLLMKKTRGSMQDSDAWVR